MRKIVAFITAITMLGTAVSCSKNAENGKADTEVSTPIQAEMLSFKEANIAMGDDFSRIISLDRNGKNVVIFGEDKNGSPLIYSTTTDFKEHKNLEFTAKDGEEVKSACIDHLGRVTVLTVLNGETMLYIYGSLGFISEEKNLGEVVPESDLGAMLYNSGDGYVINLGNESIAVIDGDMNYVGDVETGGKIILGCCKNSENTPVVILMSDKCEVSKIEGTKLTDTVRCGGISSTAYALCSGNSMYSVVGNFHDGMYGFDGEKWVKITDYMDNTFSPNNVWNILALGDSEYVVSDGVSLTLLSERDISEIKVRKTITMAFLYKGGPSDIIKKFNAENEDYKVEVVEYLLEEGSTDYGSNLNELKLDIVNGNAPDIIVNYIPGLDPAEYYIDLMDFMKDDPELNADDFIPGFLDSVSFKGTVPVIFPCFALETLVGKTKFVGEKENVTYDEFVNICESIPDDMLFLDYMNKMRMEDVFERLVDINEFLDYEKGECSFDSPDFIKMMKLVKDKKLGLTQREWEDYVDHSDEDALGYREDRLVFAERISNPYMAAQIAHASFNEPVTYVGYPSNDGVGGRITFAVLPFSIMKNAKEPEGAWEFIKYVFRDEYWSQGYFSTLEVEFEEQMEYSKNVTHYEGTGDEEYPGGRYNYAYDPDTDTWLYIDFDSFTQEEADKFEAYVRNSVKKYIWYDSKVTSIIGEELNEYFNSDRSAEKTAEIIQNRMSIYMSENYG